MSHLYRDVNNKDYQQTSPSQERQHQTVNTSQADENVDNIIGQLLHSLSALTICSWVCMKMVIGATSTQENLLDPENVR